MLKIAGALMIAESPSDTDVVATIYPALPGINREILREATPEDFIRLTHLRFDPVNACNLSCIFCHSDFSATAKQLPVEDLRVAVSYPMPKLSTISVGCAYEPLMGRYFEQYPSVLSGLRGAVQARVITNALLLHRKDITPWMEFGLEFIHASVHSHIPEVYERTVRNGGELEQVSRNLVNARVRYGAKIHLVNVISKSNDVDLPGFCHWAFDEIGVDSIDLYRAVFNDNPSPGYPIASYLPLARTELGRSPALTDDEWAALLESCSEFMDLRSDGAVHELGNVEVVRLSRQQDAGQ